MIDTIGIDTNKSCLFHDWLVGRSAEGSKGLLVHGSITVREINYLNTR